ncbi:MAG: hypothetical protein MUP66_01820 [Candidatus Nanohaloarchaeota archaeon QJJ-5]|nr:hypothetical protein [Candidatus Nanohaloarchaeota archaeon QJJ-5]
MTVQRNAARVLQYLYLIRWKWPAYEHVRETVRMDESELIKALEFLEDNDAIVMEQSMVGRPTDLALTESGMALVKDEQRFRDLFGESPNLDAIRVRYDLDED